MTSDEAHALSLTAMLTALDTPKVRLNHDLERMVNQEARERSILESGVVEALTWLESNAPGRAYDALNHALDMLKEERKR